MAQAPVKRSATSTFAKPRPNVFEALLSLFGPSEADTLRALSLDALKARLFQRVLDPGLHGLVGPRAVVQAYYERLGGNPSVTVNGFFDPATRTPVVAQEAMGDKVTLPHELAHYYGEDEAGATALYRHGPSAPRIKFGR